MNSTNLLDTERSDDSWKTIIINDQNYCIRAIEKDGGWKIYLTNLRDIWFESLDRTEILQKCEKLNPSLSIEDIDVVQFIGRLLDDIEQNAVKKSIERIEFAKELEGGIFKFSINFARGNSEQLWEQVTGPLCLVANEFCRRQSILLDLVKKKDEEITEYKLNGAELTRKHIKTTPLNENMFKSNAQKFNLESSLKAFESVMNLRHDVQLEKVSIKIEPTTEHLTEENSDNEKLRKIQEAMKSDIRDDNLATKNRESEKFETNSEIGGSLILPKTEKTVSPKYGKKLKTMNNEGDKEATVPKRAQSAPALPAKRPKKTIHDFIT